MLKVERNPPPCLPLGFLSQQTDGIIETTCTEHLDQSLSMQVAPARIFLLSCFLPGHSRAASGPYTIKTGKLWKANQVHSAVWPPKDFLTFPLFRKILYFQTFSSFSASLPPDLFNHQICHVRFLWPPQILPLWVRERVTYPNLPTKLIFMYTSRQLSSLTLIYESLTKAFLERCLKMFPSSKSVDQLS